MSAMSVLDILEETTKKCSDRIAVIDEDESFTYNMVLKQAKIIGYALSIILRNTKQKPIVLFMEKSCKCIVSMLGILYSGNIYVPLDINNPIERVNSIFEILESEYILSSYQEKSRFEKMGYKGKVMFYEELIEKYQNSMQNFVLQKIRKNIIDTDLMYILFTSGSTGIPKGVAVMHRSVIDYINALEKKVKISCDEIIGNQAPFYADMSLKDIYMSINAGAVICIIPQKYFSFPKKLLEYLEEKKVTFLMWVPTAYAIIARLDALSQIRPKYLKRFWFSGEAMPVSIYKYWRKHFPKGEYAQLYGPTEATGACTFYNILSDYEDEEIIPIGKPFENTGLILLDENNKEIKSDRNDICGEICIYGTCLAAGYYNNNEMTDKVFVQNPLIKAFGSKIYKTGDIAKWDGKGNLIFITRKDFQIKHAGKRIELGEIENSIRSIKQIETCCCIQDRKKDTLVLFYTGEIDSKSIIKRMKKKLPQYMVPMDCRKEVQLPTLPNGKLDRLKIDSWINGL